MDCGAIQSRQCVEYVCLFLYKNQPKPKEMPSPSHQSFPISERDDALKVIVGQDKKAVKVGPDTFAVGGRDHDAETPLDLPGQDGLGGGDTVTLGNALDLW